MVINEENIFSKNSKMQNTHRKSAKSWPTVGCASRHLKVPFGTLRVPIDTLKVLIGTPQVPIGAQLHQGSLIVFFVFGHFLDPFFTLFNTQKRYIYIYIYIYIFFFFGLN